MACCRALVAEYGTLEVSYGVCQNDDLFLGTLNISGHATLAILTSYHVPWTVDMWCSEWHEGVTSFFCLSRTSHMSWCHHRVQTWCVLKLTVQVCQVVFSRILVHNSQC